MSDRVLVTGADGLVGTAVSELLAARGNPFTALILPDSAKAGKDIKKLAKADKVVQGDARDPDAVGEALRDVTKVIHLAAIPSPLISKDVFAHNSQASYNVLDLAGKKGVTTIVYASSYAIGGLPFATKELHPPYLPIDTAMPLQITDPYALSKRVDEAIAEMVALAYGTTLVGLRLPFVGTVDDRLPRVAAEIRRHPERGAADVWSYLDARDAARALVAALTPARPGAHVVYVAAPDILSPEPTEKLLDAYHPGVPRPHFPGRTVPIDLEPARELLGFQAEHLYEGAGTE
jgi:nucleoside-diphosphate-sugar epimerase